MSSALMDTSNSPTRTRKSVKSTVPTIAPNEIPDPVLLLSLPSHLLHPPDHPNYVPSLHASLDALRRCIALHTTLGGNGGGSLSFEQEMRAYGMLAECGLKVIIATGGGDECCEWARGVQDEVDEAIASGMRLCQQIATLRAHKCTFSVLRAHSLALQGQLKAARTLLKREITSIPSSESSSTIYTLHLTYISLLLHPSAPDHPSALAALENLRATSTSRGDNIIASLCLATRLQILMHPSQNNNSLWHLVDETLSSAELSLSLSFPSETPDPPPPSSSQPTDTSTPLYLSTSIHVLMLGILYHARQGSPKLAQPRLQKLHDILDSDALEHFPDGTLEVVLATGPTMIVQVTHPRVLYEMAFLVSAASKRDVVGRKPKRKIYVSEGVSVAREEGKVVPVSPLNTLHDIHTTSQTLSRIHADALCELVSINISRSEFPAASSTLSQLISLTRSTSPPLFPSYAARITLLSAQLDHAHGRTLQALDKYRVSAYLAGEERETFTRLTARVGEVILLASQGERVVPEEPLKTLIHELQSSSPQLLPISQILSALLLSPSIIQVKKLLKESISLITPSSDNSLRALVLALMANMYILTASEHALVMLRTCAQLAAGLGAGEEEEGGKGNLVLAMWVGERFVEMYKRTGRDAKAAKQEEINARVRAELDLLRGSGSQSLSSSTDSSTGGVNLSGETAVASDVRMVLDDDGDEEERMDTTT